MVLRNSGSRSPGSRASLCVLMAFVASAVLGVAGPALAADGPAPPDPYTDISDYLLPAAPPASQVSTITQVGSGNTASITMTGEAKVMLSDPKVRAAYLGE